MGLLNRIKGIKPSPKPQTRRRKTLIEVSEQVITREMKSNPEFALEMALRLKKLEPPASPERYGGMYEQPSLIDQLKEIKALRKELKEIGLSDGGDSTWAKELIGLLPQLPEIIAAFQAQRQQPQQYYERIEPPVERPQLPPQQYTGPAADISEPEIITRPAPATEPEKPPTLSVSGLEEAMAMSPEEAFMYLEAEHPEWIAALAKLGSYGGALTMLNRVDSPVAARLGHEDYKGWLTELIQLCKGEDIGEQPTG